MVHEARHRSSTPAWMSRPRTVAVLAVAAAGLVAAVWLPSQNDVASADTHHRNPARYGRSSFSDDFTSGGLDLSKWALLKDNGTPVGDGASISDGEAEVTRVLRSKQTFTDAFGHAEARIKVQRKNGVWRAFSLLDADGRVPRGTIETIEGGIDPTSGRNFHTYALDWSPEEVVWTVDDKPSLRLVRQDDGGPLTLVLNLASDGDSAGRMEVDFVQVFTSPSGPPTAGPASPSPSPSEEPPSDEPPSEEPTAPPTTEPTTPPTTEPTAPPTTTSPTPPAETTPPAATTPAPANWATFTKYQVGDLVLFEGATYRVLEAHTSLPGWEPTKLPNLFEKV
jgi:cell division septation protein DedD